MKDYGQMKATLTVLEDAQRELQNRLEGSEEYLNESIAAFGEYSVKKEDGCTKYYHTDSDGSITEVNHWDYEYRQKDVTVYKQQVEAYKAVLNYLDGFKL